MNELDSLAGKNANPKNSEQMFDPKSLDESSALNFDQRSEPNCFNSNDFQSEVLKKLEVIVSQQEMSAKQQEKSIQHQEKLISLLETFLKNKN